ncbi:MAG: STAS domain-containing protein [Chloroflexia bacterium]
MQMTYSQVAGKVPVTVLKLDGNLDGSSYQSVIAAAQSLYDKGTRHLILDLTNVPYMSSAGIVALQSIAAMLRGEGAPDPDMGWSALHAVERDLSTGARQPLKLLNPQPNIDHVLETVGLKSYLEIYTDLNTALASF